MYEFFVPYNSTRNSIIKIDAISKLQNSSFRICPNLYIYTNENRLKRIGFYTFITSRMFDDNNMHRSNIGECGVKRKRYISEFKMVVLLLYITTHDRRNGRKAFFVSLVRIGAKYKRISDIANVGRDCIYFSIVFPERLRKYWRRSSTKAPFVRDSLSAQVGSKTKNRRTRVTPKRRCSPGVGGRRE